MTRIKNLEKEQIVYILNVDTGKINTRPILRVLLTIEEDTIQDIDHHDTSYILKFYLPKGVFGESSEPLLIRKSYVFGEDLSSHLGIFVNKEELFKHFEKQFDLFKKYD